MYNLSTKFMYQQNMQGFMNILQSQNKINRCLAEGRKVVNPSDDPGGFTLAMGYKNALANNQQYAVAQGFANDALGQESSVLDSVNNTLKSLKGKIVAVNKDTLSKHDRKNYTKELTSLKKQLFSLANTRDSDGNYIFAGYNNTKPAFVKDKTGKITYQGGDKAISQKVADSVNMTVGDLGDKVFAQGSNDAFDVIDQVVAALKAPHKTKAERKTFHKTLDQANKAANKLIDNLGTITTKVGCKMQQLQSLGAENQTNDTSLTQQYQQALGGDTQSTLELVSQSKMMNFALNASKEVIQSMNKMSLFNTN